MSNSQKIKKLQKKIERMKQDLAEQRVRRKQILESLQKDFGVGSIEEAEKKKDTLQKEYEIRKREFEEAYDVFCEKYDEQLADA